MKMGFHPYHMVSASPWPLFLSVSIFSEMVGVYVWMVSSDYHSALLSLFGVLICLFCWFRDIVRESSYQGSHTILVTNGIRMGVIVFILSEVMFFFSLFFGVFFISLNPDVSLGSVFPPVGVQPLSFLGVPFLNTMILLSSGVSLTWAHHSLMEGNKFHSVEGMVVTVLLGVGFVALQFVEYFESPFSIADSVYGSLFYVATGFHGIHVMLGLIMLLTSTVRLSLNHFSNFHLLGFEASAWYWHFVDVVWMFLFVSIYWWMS
uniref:Cytochrome c oxidase subunit 3 n=1 Tax=Haematopinus asini TaxID=1461129 RepID=A0A059T424_9NEOP|nr:cytochrome c oxidase subunit III [Haematopinus asini]